MNKPLYIAAAVALALSVSACGRDDEAPIAPTSSATPETTLPSTPPSSGPLVTGESAPASPATGGTSGSGAMGESGSSTAPGMGGTGPNDPAMSPGGNTPAGSSTAPGYGADSEKSQR